MERKCYMDFLHISIEKAYRGNAIEAFIKRLLGCIFKVKYISCFSFSKKIKENCQI